MNRPNEHEHTAWLDRLERHRNNVKSPGATHDADCQECQELEYLGLAVAEHVRQNHPAHRPHADVMTDGRLAQWLTGELSPADDQAVEAALFACPVCRYQAQQLPSQLEAFGLQPLEARWSKLEALISTDRPKPPRRRWSPINTGWLAAAVLALVLPSALWWQRSSEHGSEPDDQLQEVKAVVASRAILVHADVLQPGSDSEPIVQDKLDSETRPVGECPAGGQLRFRLQATGEGILSAWKTRGPDATLIRVWPQQRFGAEVFPLMEPPAAGAREAGPGREERFRMPIGTAGTETYSLVLTPDAPPARAGREWLERLIRGPDPHTNVGSITCKIRL